MFRGPLQNSILAAPAVMASPRWPLREPQASRIQSEQTYGVRSPPGPQLPTLC